MTFREVETLFHEFGHGLQHMLTTVDYADASGINGVEWDAVELPSQFMENFAWNYEVLQRCSAHAETGAALPKDLFERLENSRHTGAAIAMMRQLEVGLFDFRLPPDYDSLEGPDVLARLADVRRGVSPWHPPA